jgi:FlaA1/EpsC-like NDP-sugar epimerase
MDLERNRVLIIGGGQSGKALLELLLSEKLVHVVGIVDQSIDAPGIVLARSRDIPTYSDLELAVVASGPCLVLNLTGATDVATKLEQMNYPCEVINGIEAVFKWHLERRMREIEREPKQ